MKMEQTECSETLAYKIQMPGNYPEESTQHLSLINFINDGRNAWLFITIIKAMG
jgi:hypothetical protein